MAREQVRKEPGASPDLVWQKIGARWESRLPGIRAWSAGLGLFCLLALAAWAQTPTLVDANFNPRAGADNDVFAVALQDDGRILLGGQFTQFDGTNRGHIARLNADGSLDSSFDPGSGTDGDVYAVAVQPDGKVLIGGAFTRVTGTTNQYLARLNADGTVDSTFNAGTNLNNELRALAVQPDGRILIGGRFTRVGGQTRNRIARLESNGTLDTTFNPGSGADNSLRTLLLTDDGRILIGGQFTTFNGTNRVRIARLNADGSLDLSFNPGTGADDQVRAIAVHTNGMIYIGGDFEIYNGTNKSAVARLFPDGGLDLGFDQGDPDNDTVRAIAVQPDGRVWIGGLFAQAGGAARANLARLNPDGSADRSFDPSPDANDEVFALAFQPDGRLLVGGKFTVVDSVARRKVARLRTHNEAMLLAFDRDTVFVPENLGPAQAPVRRRGWLGGTATVEVTAFDGTALVGEDYQAPTTTLTFAPMEAVHPVLVPILDDAIPEANETFVVRLANPGGTAVLGVQTNAQVIILDNEFQVVVDTTFQAPDVNGALWALAVQPDGRIVIGGEFFYTQGCLASYLDRLLPDGAVDCSFNTLSQPSQPFGFVYALAVQPDGKIIAGGGFTNFNGVAHRYLTRVTSNGAPDLSFNVGTNLDSLVWSLALQPDGKIVIGGYFRTYGGVPRSRIARLNADGSLDATFDPGAGADREVLTVNVQPDGKILIGGVFTNVAGARRPHLARLNANGSLDAGFNAFTGTDDTVHGITLQPDGKILIGGQFHTVNATHRDLIARLQPDGSLDPDFDVGTIFGEWVRSIALQADGKVVLGGYFSYVNQAFRENLARVHSNGALDLGFNLTAGANGEVRIVQVLPQGKLLVAGNFLSVEGIPSLGIARLLAEPSINRFDFNWGSQTIPETAGSLDLVVRRGGDSSGTVSVDYATVDDTALAGLDYAAQVGTLVFHPLETVKTISIPILNDDLPEGVERFSIRLSNPSVGAVLGQVSNSIVDISDNDRGFEVSVPELFVREEAGVATVHVRRGGDGPGTVTVDYATADGTAQAGSDYTAQAGTLTFGPGETEKPVTIPIATDAVFEGRETFQLRLSNPGPGAALGTQVVATITLADEDSVFYIGLTNVGAEPGNAPVFSVERRGAALLSASVRVSTADGTATANLDYVPFDQVLTFAPGQTHREFAIPVLNDGLIEPTETLNLSLSQPTGQSILVAPSNAVMEILDNDTGIAFVRTNLWVDERSGQASVEVRRGDDGTNVLTVEFATMPGTATTGQDFSAQSGTLTLLPGETRTIVIPLEDDCGLEPEETFQVALSNPGPGASLGAVTNAVVTIIDSDRPGSVDLGFDARLENNFLGVQHLALAPAGGLVLGDSYWFKVGEAYLEPLLRLLPDGSLDPSFGPNTPGFYLPDNWVTCLAAQPDGRILYGSRCDVPNGDPGTAALTRLTADGVLDPTFSRLMQCTADQVAVQNDGKIVVAGDFDALGRLLRLNPDGTRDTNFHALPRVYDGFSGILPLPDGKLLLLPGGVVGIIERLNADGSHDPTFVTGLKVTPILSYVDGRANTAVRQPDGRIVIGGRFNFVNEVAFTNVARLLSNGAPDTNFNTTVGANGEVAALDLQPDGRIVLAGSFTLVQGAPRSGVARLNTDGSLDPTFDPGLGPAGTVTALRVLPDGGILVAGRFDTFNDVPRRDLVRLHSGLAPGRFTSVTRRPDGVAEVQLAGPRCRAYVIEGSTDLQQWLPISTNEVTNGTLLIEDPDARSAAQRFYRAWQVVP